MGDVVTRVRNAEAPWENFSSDDYWRHNYEQLQPVDQEIILQVSQFFLKTFAARAPEQRRARRAIDVGSGTNLYPALLMLPWTESILLTDYSPSNVSWLRDQVDEDASWIWDPFWRIVADFEGYRELTDAHKQLRVALQSENGDKTDRPRAGIEQYSVFDLPAGQWQMGTMFFVAESITEDRDEFHDAIDHFVHALEPGAPFAAAFMAGSDGYPVADKRFPALQITAADVRDHFTHLAVSNLDVRETETHERVREGYTGMIIATGLAGGH